MTAREFGVVAGGFVIVPHELLDEAPDSAVVMVYISLYRHGHGSREGCWCSQQRLSQESGIYLKGVRRALLWLEEHGWVQGDHRSGRTAIYQVITQRHHGRNAPRSKTTQVENDLGGRSKTTQVPRSKTTYEQEPSNKNPRTRTLNPPLTPASGGAPPAAAKRARATKAPAPSVDPATAELPALLEPYRSQITRFWNEHKGGVKTAGAWTLLVGQLQRIEAEVPGALPSQFDAAETRAVNRPDRKFETISYANWSRYGRETHASRSDSRQTFLSGSRQADNAARAIARLQQPKPHDALAALIAKQDAQLAAMKAITVEVLP